MRLFLCGDVMTGRGIDQIMPHPCDPTLYEPHLHSALDYVALAERNSGEIPRAVPFDYIWGDALDEIDRREPDFRIVNLETSITADGVAEAKGINYRMHPDNVGSIAAADIDCCVIANNHIADWGASGLTDSLDALERAGIAMAGAGRDATAASHPAILEAGHGGRVLVLAFACPSSGVPRHWSAGAGRPGVNFLADLGKRSRDAVVRDIRSWKRPGDVIVVSIHWGPNWGYDVPTEHRDFAHALIEQADVKVVHGHSVHHPMAIELHGGAPILYGCGDFINDYEGIGGYHAFRPDLTLGYFLELDDGDHSLRKLEMVPFQMRKFRLNRASDADALWLTARLDRECGRFGHHVGAGEGGTLRLSW